MPLGPVVNLRETVCCGDGPVLKKQVNERNRLITAVINSLRACANIVAMTKRLFRAAIKMVVAIAAAVFFLARMTTSTGMLWFVGSIIVLLVCFVLLRFLAEDDEDTGYWPPSPKA